MKNKKIIASVLGIACVAILIGVAVITPKKNHTFTPEASEAASNDSWEEKHTPPASGRPPCRKQKRNRLRLPALQMIKHRLWSPRMRKPWLRN